MATPGWYPDPDGTRGGVRYWDGTRWGESRQGPASRSLPFWVFLVVGALVVGLGVWFVARGLNTDPPSEPPVSRPVSNDPDGPIARPTSPPPSPTPTPTASAVPCPMAGFADSSGATDLNHAGLTVTAPEGWAPYRSSVSVALRDQRSAHLDAEGSSWMSFMTVGYADRSEFPDAESASRQVIECHVTSGRFSGYTGHDEVSVTSPPHGEDGAWLYEMQATSTNAPGGGALFIAYAVDLGHAEGISVFWGGAVNSDAKALNDLRRAALSVEPA